MSTDNVTTTLYRDLRPGTWIWADTGREHPEEVRHVEPRPTTGEVVVMLAGGYFDVAPAGDRAVVATADEVAAAKERQAREGIASGLERLADAYRDARMPLPSHNSMYLHEAATTEAALRGAAKVLGVEVKPARQPGSLVLEWESAPWSEDGARVTLTMRADVDETPAEVEGPSAGTAGPGEEPATAPVGEETPAGAATLDQTRVDHDTAAILGAVARGVARAPRPGGTR